MAAKLLHSLTDENPDLEKQIGCMTGIFQLFDRQQILTGGRHIVGHTPKRHSPGRFHAGGNTLEQDSNGKYSDKIIRERQRSFSELSRASFSSSSRSSSFSSLDYSRATQLEPASLDRIIFPETPSMEPEISLKNSSPQFSRRSLDLRDFVKDSMYREVQGLSKAKTGEVVEDPAVKHGESPRLQSRISDGYHGSCIDTRQKIRADLKESVRVLSELQEAPWYPNEPRGLLRSSSYHAKDASSCSIAKDTPRFSCDGREVNREPFEPRDFPKSTLKLKDFSRYSLDSRDGPMRNLNANSKSNLFSKSSQKDSHEIDGKVPTQNLTPGHQARPPSVVAKLMGLEALPGPVSSGGTNTGSDRSYPEKDHVKLSRISSKADPNSIKPSASSKNLWKDPSSPRWRNPDSSMKPIPRVPIEPAPWKQIDGSRCSKKPVRAKVPTTFPSVYSEIEERLKDLEFTRSGRDLRALKQILEAMQSKGFLGIEEGLGSNSTGQKDNEQRLLSSKHESRLANIQMPQTSEVFGSTKRKTGSSSHYESPIVIMKPANLVGKSGLPSGSVISLDVLSGLPKLQDDEVADNWNRSGSALAAKELSSKLSQRHNTVNHVTVKADRGLKSAQASTRSHQLVKDGNVGSRKSSESISPRMQQKKLEPERRFRPPTSPDSTKSRRQPNKQQQVDCHSPGSRRRLKYPGFPQSNNQLSELNVVPKNSNHHEKENSVQSNESIMWSSKNVVVCGFERSIGISSCQNPSMKNPELEISSSIVKKITLVPSDDEAAEFGFVPLEYSSPVSVLNNIVCKDNSPSPIKEVDKSLEERASDDVVPGSSMYRFVPNSKESHSISEIDQIKLQAIDNLVWKLRTLNSSHDETPTDYLASLGYSTDLDHRYISEILRASGLLLEGLGSSLMSFQFHSSDHPINPELFSVLEQTKARSTLLKCGSEMKEKLDRRLIFDTVNEILARKLASAGPFSNPQFQQVKLSRWVLNAEKLVRELFSEIEEIRAKTPKCSAEEEDARWKNILCKDVMHQSASWMDFEGGISGAVLDIERSIFKDLVNEIVIGESGGMKAKPRRRRVVAR